MKRLDTITGTPTFSNGLEGLQSIHHSINFYDATIAMPMASVDGDQSKPNNIQTKTEG